MQNHVSYDYAIVRIVPKVERDEFINIGAVISCPAKDYLDTRIEWNEKRLIAIDPTLDLLAIRSHLEVFPAICAGGDNGGPIGVLSQRERFRWLTAPKSTVIQTSPVHTGQCVDPADALERLLDTMVRQKPATVRRERRGA